MFGLSIEQFVAPLVAGILVAQTMNMVSRLRHRRRAVTADIKEAVTISRDFEEAFSEFLAFEAPDLLKQNLLTFSALVGTEDAARQFANLLLDYMRTPIVTPRGQAVSEALEQLREHRPGMAQVFDRAIVSGLMAAFKRWPKVGRLYVDGYAALVVHREQQVDRVVRVAQAGGFDRSLSSASSLAPA